MQHSALPLESVRLLAEGKAVSRPRVVRYIKCSRPMTFLNVSNVTCYAETGDFIVIGEKDAWVVTQDVFSKFYDPILVREGTPPSLEKDF